MTSKAPKRPRDFSQAAKFVIDVATGQREDRAPTPEERGKNEAAAALGRIVAFVIRVVQPVIGAGGEE